MFYWGPAPNPNPKPPTNPPRFLSKMDRFFDINTKTRNLLLGAGPQSQTPTNPEISVQNGQIFLTSTQKQQTFVVLKIQ